MLFYLSGSIEYSPDYGKGWRRELTPLLTSLGHTVYDPALDEKKNLTGEELKNFRRWKTEDLSHFQATIRKIIDYDLNIIEQKCDAVIVLWDEYATRGAGTHAEVTAAYRHGIPVYLVAGMPLPQVSGWIMGCSSRIFDDFAQLQEFLSREMAGR